MAPVVVGKASGNGESVAPAKAGFELAMKFLPYDKFQLVVNEPLSQVRDRILANVGPRRFWGIFSSAEERSFNGKVEDASFKISRNIHYRNSFLPTLHGSLEPHPSGTRITVRMKLHPFVVVFLVFWIGMAFSFTLPFTPVAFWAEIGELLVMIGFAVALTYLGFWFEAKKSKAIFLDIFKQAEVVLPAPGS